MGQIVPISLNLASNPAWEGAAGAARLINAYAEEAGTEAKAPWNLRSVDGLASFATGTTTNGGKIRAMLALSDAEMLVLSDRNLYLVDQSGGATSIGGIPTTGFVTMARNRVAPHPQVAIVSSGLYYIYQNGTLTQQADDDLPNVISVSHLNGYFIFLTEDGLHYASDLDSANVTALAFAAAESNPDIGIRNWTRGQDSVIGGARSLEFWRDVGETPYPFNRVTTVDVGVLAPDSVAEVDQTSAFVAHDGTVRILNGYEPQRISTHAVERSIAAETRPQDIEACSWQSRGHTFYCISGDAFSWVYDTVTRKWHERRSYDLTRWRVSKTARFGTKIIAGDYATGAIYELDPDTYTEAGSHMIMTVQPPPVHAFPHRLAFNGIYVDVIPGVGLVSTDTSLSDPSLMIDYSDDGGQTWSAQRFEALGRASQDLTRVKSMRLGSSRSRTFRISVSAAVARGIIGAAVDIDKLRP